MEFRRSLIFILILNLIGCGSESPIILAYVESTGAVVRVKDADNTNTATVVATTAANNLPPQPPMQAVIEVTNCGTL